MALADQRTLETLDFASVLDRVVAQTRTQRGRRRASELEPALHMADVRNAQAATAEVRELVASTDFSILPALDPADLTQGAAVGKTLSPQDLRLIADAISAAAAAYNKTRERESDILAALTQPYRPLKEVQRAIVDAVDERGAVLDGASPALARVRKNLQHAQSDARERVASLLRSPKYAKAIQDAVVTIREGRFVVPVKAEFSGEFPGIVHDTSSSGQTLFVEPLGALESNNRLRTLRIQEEREIARVLEELSRLVGNAAEQIERNVEMLATLDVLAAKASLARVMDSVVPELLETPTLVIHDGRHPLLGARAVPQSLELNDEIRLLVISGPNMGGKTVALKMVGLFVAMTYCGMQIPAGAGTQIGCFERIFTDIGDEQSIAENASTFSAHLGRMREIIAEADRHSLVLVDEIGGGTEPNSGAALAIAMLEGLLAVRACGIVTTHATELKLFAHAQAGVANASVRFDPNTFAPTYYLDIGLPGQSLAFPLARTLGIPPEIISRAESLLATRERDYERALTELSEVNAQLQSERATLGRERAHLDRLGSNLRSRTDALERERRQFVEAAEGRMAQALRDFTAELQRRAAAATARPKVTASQSALLSRTIEDMRRDLGVRSQENQEDAHASYAPEDVVRILSLHQDGTVIADYGDTVLVAIGAMKTVVQKNDLERRGYAPALEVKARRRQAEAGIAKMEASMHSVAELDVRGKRYVEAEPLVDRWIDEAVLAGNSPLRLIHGKGTGLLGRGLQEYLRAHQSVGAIRYGNENEGGGGVTIFELRET